MSDVRLNMSEKDFQALIVRLARLNGWLVYHTFDSRRSEKGFPDLVMVHPATKRHIVAEVKTERGRVAPEQTMWLEAYAEAGVPAHVFRPSDWDYIQQVLARRKRVSA